MKMMRAASSSSTAQQWWCYYSRYCLVVLLVATTTTTITTTTVVMAKGGQRDSFSRLLKMFKRNYPDWNPRAILDIGANAGAWSTSVRNQYPDSKILMLEASDAHIPALEETVYNIDNAKYRIAALTAHDGDLILPDAAQTDLSPHKKTARQISITLDTLVREEATDGEHIDSFLDADKDVFDLIKLDIHGAELLVLQGGMETLSKASVIQFVATSVALQPNDSCFFEMDQLLRSKGFYLYDHADDDANEATKLMTYQTLGLGQWGMIYVNLNSDYVPHQLKSRAPNFCGMKKQQQRPLSSRAMKKLSSRLNYNFIGGDDYNDDSFWKIVLPALALGACIGILLSCVVVKCRRPKNARRKL